MESALNFPGTGLVARIYPEMSSAEEKLTPSEDEPRRRSIGHRSPGRNIDSRDRRVSQRRRGSRGLLRNEIVLKLGDEGMSCR